VLGILAAALVAAYADLRARVRAGLNSDAQSTCLCILNAIEQYDMEHDRLPVTSPGDQDRDLLSDNDSGIIAALKGMDTGVNRRKKDYLGDIKEAKLVDGKPFNGVWHGKGNSIGLYDPWGHSYCIRLDTDGDGYVEDPSAPGKKIKTFAVIWSAGKDRDFSTRDDNVGTFEAAR